MCRETATRDRDHPKRLQSRAEIFHLRPTDRAMGTRVLRARAVVIWGRVKVVQTIKVAESKVKSRATVEIRVREKQMASSPD